MANTFILQYWKRAVRGVLVVAALFSLAFAALAGAPSAADDQRARALLAQMTLDEKIGQMTQVDCLALSNRADVRNYFLGSVLSGGGHAPARPDAQGWRDWSDEFRSWALQTRLKIPLLYGIDAVHGHNGVDGAVIFPHNIALGATRDPKLVERAARVTAEEVAATDIQWAFAPCVAIARDEHWGRTYESFGQTPELVSEMGAAVIRGFQGSQLTDASLTLACAKHYLADGGTAHGKDQGNAICDEATLRELFLPPYVAAVQAGAGSIMVSYSSWNGLKMSAQKHLITDVLKGELGFEGIVVSDWAAIDQLSPNYKADVAAGINAGLDMIMIPNGPGKPNNFVEFIRDLKELVAEGTVPQSRIDDAVTRILRVKYQMGLFERAGDDSKLMAAVGSAAHREVARQCVRESLVLLKNSNHALPLSKHIKHLHVIGAAADDIGTQCGGWTMTWQGQPGPVIHGGTTLLAAIRQAVGPDTAVTFSPDGKGATGAHADAIVAVVGERPYAEGEGDTNDLRLSAKDRALLSKAAKTGSNVITIIYSGRPLVLGAALKQSAAILAAWQPGSEGEGVTDILFGDYAPTGKLPRNWPANNKDVAVTQKSKPQFPFGFGLTYANPDAGRSAGTSQ